MPPIYHAINQEMDRLELLGEVTMNVAVFIHEWVFSQDEENEGAKLERVKRVSGEVTSPENLKKCADKIGLEFAIIKVYENADYIPSDLERKPHQVMK
jgi:hypothetical protein